MIASSVKRLISGFFLVACLGAVADCALAGDSAQLNVIGYSRDGHIFAFEEFGVQDGAGFAYSTYFFVDITTDSFLPGTPIRVQADDEASFAATRRNARQKKAEPLIRKYALDDRPAYILAYNPVSEAQSDPHRLQFHGFPISPPLPQVFTLVLTEKPLPATKDCLDMTGNYSGFSLVFSDDGGQITDRLVHEDQQIPASRNCPNGYRIGAVVAGDTGLESMVAMIQVSSFGFEGNDERWIAVPLSAANR